MAAAAGPSPARHRPRGAKAKVRAAKLEELLDRCEKVARQIRLRVAGRADQRSDRVSLRPPLVDQILEEPRELVGERGRATATAAADKPGNHHDQHLLD